MITFLKKIKKNFHNREYTGIVRSLAAKNVSIGLKNRIHSSVSFETAGGGKIVIGTGNEILNGCLLMTYGGSILMGNNCSINPYTVLYGHGKGLTIGNNVLIAGHCLIIPSNHVFSRTDVPIKSQGATSVGIIIEDDVWIAAGCQILDGVTLGKGSVIAAGSVVNKTVEPYSIVGGVPAKIIKMRLH